MRRAVLVTFLVILAVPVVAVVAAGPLLDSAAARARLTAALERATSHPVRLDGPVGIGWSLVPTLSVRGVTVLNGPGFSRAALATIPRLEARVALLPLLAGRVEVRALTLEQPDVLLERDAAGHGSWAPVLAGPVPSAPGPASAPGPRMAVEVQGLLVEGGTLAWRGGPTVSIRRLDLRPSGGPAVGEILVNGVPFVLGGTMVAHRLDLQAVAPGLTLGVAGEPGGTLSVQGQAPDLAALAPLAGRPLPSLRDVRLEATWPGPAAMRLTAGASALDAVMPGLALQQLTAEAAALDQPLRVTAALRLRDLGLAAAVNTASLAGLAGAGPLPVQAKLLADGGAVDLQGMVDPAARTAELTVSARIPDLRRAGVLAGQGWPGLRNLAVDARLMPRPGVSGVLVRGLRLSADEGDVAGDLALGTLPRPSLRGSLVSQRLDLDAILGPVAAAPTTAAAPGPASAVLPASPPPPASSAAAAPFAALTRADADLRLAADQVSWHATAYRAFETRLLLQDGRLRLDPARVLAPGGLVQGQLLADAAAVPPTASLTLRAPALEAAPLATALGRPGAATGTVELDLQATGAGQTWSALAATLQGHLAAAMADGEIDNAVLATLFGPALRAVNVPAEAAGRSRLRCLVVRADATGGQVALRTLALDSSRLRLEGEGGLNLVDDTMDLHLRPTIRLGPTTVAVPVRVSGPFRAPVPAMERGVVAPGRFGLSIGGAAADPCPAALAAVHAR